MTLQCKICSKTYQKSVYLESHLERVHGIRLSEKKQPDDDWEPPPIEDVSIDENAFDELPDLSDISDENTDKKVSEKISIDTDSKLPKKKKSYKRRELNLRKVKIEIIKKYKLSKSQQNKRYKCPVCPSQFLFKYQVNRHAVYRNHFVMNKKKIYKKITKKKKDLEKKTKVPKSDTVEIKKKSLKSKTSNNFECKSCLTKFTKLEKLILHKLGINNQCRLPLGCSLCNVKFKSSGTTKQHEKISHNLGSVVYDCTLCKESFVTVDKGEVHLKSAHLLSDKKSFEEIYRDRRESFIFMSYRPFFRNSKLHYKRVYRCPICNNRFSSMEYTENHMKIKHNDEFECKICKKKSYVGIEKLGHLSRHWKVITTKESYNGSKTEKEYQCLLCLHSDKNISDIIAHIKYLHMFKEPKLIVDFYKKKIAKKIISPSLSSWEYLSSVNLMQINEVMNKRQPISPISLKRKTSGNLKSRSRNGRLKKAAKELLPVSEYSVSNSTTPSNDNNSNSTEKEDLKLRFTFEKKTSSEKKSKRKKKRKRSETDSGCVKFKKARVDSNHSLPLTDKKNEEIEEETHSLTGATGSSKNFEHNLNASTPLNPIDFTNENQTVKGKTSKPNESVDNSKEVAADCTDPSSESIEKFENSINNFDDNPSAVVNIQDNKENIIATDDNTEQTESFCFKSVNEENIDAQYVKKLNTIQDKEAEERVDKVNQSQSKDEREHAEKTNLGDDLQINLESSNVKLSNNENIQSHNDSNAENLSQKTLSEPSTNLISTITSYNKSNCKACSIELSIEDLKVHMSQHIVIMCEYCSFSSTYEHQIKNHIKSFHSLPEKMKETSLKCEFCNMKGDNEKIISHLIEECELLNAKYRCPECKFCCESRQKLDHHREQSHLNAKDLHTCVKCDYSTKNWIFFQIHEESKHENKGADLLSSETKQFFKKFKARLLNGIAMLAKSQSKFFCRMCDFEDTNLEPVVKHLTANHSEPYKVSERLVDSGKIEFKCLHCGNILSNLSYMIYHLTNVHNRKDITKSSLLNSYKSWIQTRKSDENNDDDDSEVIYLMTTFEQTNHKTTEPEVICKKGINIEIEHMPEQAIPIRDTHIKIFDSKILDSLVDIGREKQNEVRDALQVRNALSTISTLRKPNNSEAFIDLTLEDDDINETK